MSPKIPSFNGNGAFLASADMKKPPERLVRELNEMACTYAVVLVEGYGKRRQPLSRIDEITAALRAADIAPHGYSLPAPVDATAAADHLGEVAARFHLPPVLDAEGPAWTEALIAACFARIAESGFAPAITVFTQPEWKDVDWNVAAPEVPILLQVYLRAAAAARLRDAMLRFPPSRKVIPLYGTYLGDVDRLFRDLTNVRPWARAGGASGLWCLATSDEEERAVVKDWTIETFRAT